MKLQEEYIDRRHALKLVGGGVVASAGVACAPVGEAHSPVTSVKHPLVIAHRGASGYLPEHTLAAYRRAIEMGADYIEPDLVFTKDSVLIARHDKYLSSTTDVASRPEFADRRRTVDGREDWFSEDFALEEIKSLRARQSYPGRSLEFDGLYEVPTFEEVLELAVDKAKVFGRTIGVYPETKSPSHYKSLGHNFASSLISALEKHDFNRKDAPVFIQSFETQVLQELRGMTSLPLVFLAAGRDGYDLMEISQYCDGFGPYKRLLVTDDLKPTGLFTQAQELGLQVHPWTFRADDIPAEFSSALDELAFYFELGVDGVFTDFPDIAVEVRSSQFGG